MSEQDVLKEQLGKYKDLDILTESDGGKVLLTALRKQIANDVETIASLLKAPEMELRTAVAKLTTNLGVYRTLTNAKQNAIITEEELTALLSRED
jgi:hypothetical protein